MTLRPTRSLPVRLLAIAGVAALGIGLAGCSGGDGPDGKASGTATAQATATERPAITDVDTPAGGDGEYVGALKDVQVSSCKKSGSEWAVEGTVENPAKSAQGYRIYVSLLKGQSDTRAVKEVDVDSVAAGASDDWSTTIGTSESGLSCVLRVERFAA
ncbi:hypothetical protein BIU97_14035 [Curtobacterium sp. MCBA15_009]|uniref:hypothetical protein n=1 Tax=Curtobacterium sp. MCBA15_009 TaxID=1898737 RepID=UPI0008DD7616|nr:hypothetical protein [Curtobacterium sp. MCBA15_009]OII15785.1 hypothetical protein BIU97_14035 [Curtobacterium sp. MCBA15_009]